MKQTEAVSYVIDRPETVYKVVSSYGLVFARICRDKRRKSAVIDTKRVTVVHLSSVEVFFICSLINVARSRKKTKNNFNLVSAR